ESYTVGDRIFIRLRNSAPLSNVFLQWSDSRGLYYQLEDIGYSTDLNGSVIIGPFPGGSGLPDTWPIGTSFKIKARVANIWSQESIYSVSNGARPPVPNPRPLLCMSYNVTVSDQTLRDISKWQVGVLDYYQSPAEIGAQLSRVGTGLKAFVPIYHNASDSISQIYERTRLFADQVRPYLAYVLGIYVWDEPDFNKVSFDKQQAAVDAVRQYLPGVPTYIYFSSSDGAPMPANLTYRGMPFYGKDSKDLTVVRRRLERVGAYAPRIIAVPRAWNDFGKCCDGAYGIWSDIEIAQMNAALFPELVRTPQVAGVMYYVWNIRPEDKHPSGTVGTQDLPETRKVLESVCAGY
ncbi:MAG: hypothetical protein Q8L47_03605, partial [bacterium]|nr:hypothetical protein [bacterium]